MLAECLEIFSHQATPITPEFGLSIIIITHNSSVFYFITSTKTSTELKKKKISFLLQSSLILKEKTGKNRNLPLRHGSQFCQFSSCHVNSFHLNCYLMAYW